MQSSVLKTLGKVFRLVNSSYLGKLDAKFSSHSIESDFDCILFIYISIINFILTIIILIFIFSAFENSDTDHRHLIGPINMHN